MIPALVAHETRESILDYLRTTWALSNPALESALFEFLEGKGELDRGIFRGPYIRARLPFSPKPQDAVVPLEIRPPYDPYLHQLQAWQRLSSRDGAEPQPTLVTTGTGSGKTECFLYPILDHCFRAQARGEAGIKAIVLYPMNALAADQARRFAEVIHGDQRTSGRLRVGMYVGGDGRNHEMSPSGVIDHKENLLKNPPDILLTNYRMLDLLLLRPKDQALWKLNRPGTLRYLVLDELHTYDGAQGTDVACLIRRLMARLGGQDAVCPVGTSATVASDSGDGQEKLLQFASAVFDQPFEEAAVIGERRRSPEEFFGLFGQAFRETYPPDASLLSPEPGEEIEQHTLTLARLWFPEVMSLTEAPREQFRLVLGQTVMRHPFARAILRETSSRLLDESELDARLCARLPEFGARPAPARKQYVTSMLSLLAWSQRSLDKNVQPLIQLQVQLWVREVRHLLREVRTEPRFIWRDDQVDALREPALPMYFCRECGHSGWIAKYLSLGLSDELSVDYAEVAQAYLQGSEDLVYLHQDAHASDDDGPLRQLFFHRTTRRLGPTQEKASDPSESVPLFGWVKLSQGSPRRDLRRCPACEADSGLSMLASRSASLASVAVGHLYTTPLNTDRKLLAFSDSVQDASHRAGFFSGRTYRFSIRSGMLAVVPEAGTIRLSEVAPAMFHYWSAHAPSSARASSQATLVAAFMPHDLEFLDPYAAYIEALTDRAERLKEADERGQEFDEPMPEPSSQLLRDLETRMNWEVTREFGVAARIGRTLERSGAASVALDPSAFERAVHLVTERIPERIGALTSVQESALRQFLVGLLNRLRLRGGIYDQLLRGYFESGGDSFQLNKRMQPLLSPFGDRTTRPTFLGTSAQGAFDNVAPRERPNWYSDWARRSLGVELSLDEARSLYADVLPLLVRAEVLVEHSIPGKTYWALRPSALVLSRDHAFRVCNVCAFEQPTVAGGASDPLGQPCPRYRCEGRLEKRSDARAARSRSFYRRFYERKSLGRVWSKEHTGLLERSDREDLELAFKERPRPDAPNMLSCTPTLEMGIDIGDLSATMLCSVPPSTANYLQRVGRAGRSTGNALILTFASSQRHDQYFYDDPMAVMEGAIQPPGCYLDAPEVLKRQALAYAFDRFAHEGGKVPTQVRDLLAEGNDGFQSRFREFARTRREALCHGFLELFGREALRPDSTQKLRAFMTDERSGISPMVQRLEEEIARARDRRDTLRTVQRRLADRRKELEADLVAQRKSDDSDEELKNVRQELGYLKAEIVGLLDQDFWGHLCDRSLLPNYAFPEAGVTLQAFVRSERGGEGHDATTREFQWVRAPSSAIAELAPFNTFYGSGHKVEIENIAIDRKDRGATEWQFCAECHHSEPTAEIPTNQETCPRCNAPGFREAGRRRFLVKLDQVRAFTRQRDSVVSDEKEERSRTFYELHNFYEVDGSARDAWSNETVGFGFEFLPEVRLRRINFGERDARAPTSNLAGRPIADVAHVVCTDCGQVSEPTGRARDARRARPGHRSSCPSRNKSGRKQPLQRVHLVRELSSEAIRLVLPVARDDVQTKVANVRAALRLGLREFYGGEPDHFAVDTYDEPAGQEGRRNFLLIQDMVPGGTGLLAELATDKGSKLKAVLECSARALAACSCQTRSAKACYRCLYAYREQNSLPVLDRARALSLVDAMLDAFRSLKKVETIGTLRIDSILESELEHRFREVLKGWSEREGIEVENLDGERLRLTLAGRTWRYEPQVTLAEDEVLHKCRPDFILYPEGQEPDVRPVAGFADGVAYHVQPGLPEGRIHDDFRKRAGIVASGRYVTWSFGWDDLDAFERTDALGSWMEGNVLKTLERLLNGLGLSVSNVATADPIRALLGYLTAPREWPVLAGCMAAAALHAGGKQGSREAVVSDYEQILRAESPTLRLHDSMPGTDHLWTRMPFGIEGEGTLLLEARKAEAGTLHANPASVRGVLRLVDGAEQRSKKHYVRTWRLFLRAYNLLQFLPNVEVVTDEQLSSGIRQPFTRAAEPEPPSFEARLPSPENEGLLSELENVAPAWVEVVRQSLLAGHDRVFGPLEVRDSAQSGDIELGWPDERVGLFLDSQRETAAYLRSLGWRLFALEADPEPSQLMGALSVGAGDGRGAP